MDQAETRPGKCRLSGVGLEGEDTPAFGPVSPAPPHAGSRWGERGPAHCHTALQRLCHQCCSLVTNSVWTDVHMPKFRCLPVFMVVLLT